MYIELLFYECIIIIYVDCIIDMAMEVTELQAIKHAPFS